MLGWSHETTKRHANDTEIGTKVSKWSDGRVQRNRSTSWWLGGVKRGVRVTHTVHLDDAGKPTSWEHNVQSFKSLEDVLGKGTTTRGTY